VLALSGELGDRAPTGDGAALDADPVRASFEAAARAPIGPLDAQRLLELDDPSDRLQQLEGMLQEAAEVLQFRLSGG